MQQSYVPIYIAQMSIRLRRRTNEMIYASVTLRRDHSKPLNKRSHDPRKWAPKTTQIVKVTRNICFAQGAKQTNKQAQNEIPELYNIVLLKVPNKQAQNEIHELYNMKYTNKDKLNSTYRKEV